MKSTLLIILALGFGYLIGFSLSKGPNDDHSSMPPTKDLKAIERWSASKAPPSSRMQAIAQRAAELTPEEWPSFFRGQLHSAESSRLAARLWAESDPSGFWNWLKKSRDRNLIKRFADDLLGVWVQTEPEAAMAAALQVTDKGIGDTVRRTVIDAVLATDLEQGLAFAAMAGNFNSFSFGERPWIRNDPSGAVLGLAELPKISTYRRFLEYAVPIWAEENPAAALAWMSGQQADGEVPPWIRKGFKTAAQADPQAALAAVEGIDSPNLRSEAIAGIVGSGKLGLDAYQSLLGELTFPIRAKLSHDLMRSRPSDSLVALDESAAMLDQLPGNKGQLYAVRSLAFSWARLDQPSAWDWANSLTDPAMRRKAFAAIAPTSSPEQIASLDHLDLSNELFSQALERVPSDQRDEWISQLPADLAEWAKTQNR